MIQTITKFFCSALLLDFHQLKSQWSARSQCCILCWQNISVSCLQHSFWTVTYIYFVMAKSCLVCSLLPPAFFYPQPSWNHTQLLFLRSRKAFTAGDTGVELSAHLSHAAHGLGPKISQVDRKCGWSFHIKQQAEEWGLCIVKEGARM